MKKRGLAMVLLLSLVITIVGCKKQNEATKEELTPTPTEAVEELEDPTPTQTEEATETPTPTKEAEVAPEGMARSKLTGEWVDKKVTKQRPYAVMMNNISVANPQSGIGEASIVYEALTEGGITRLMAIFEDLYDEDGKLLERIGSCRSARHYFVSFADEYDAIFVHYGQTKYATKKIEKLHVNNLSGLTWIGDTVFYRDKSIKAPHNAFASGKGILEGTKKLKYRTKYEKGYKSHFKFYKEDMDLGGTQTVNKVTLKYSNFAPYFEYDQESKTYKRFQYGGKHIDYNTKKQLEFKNIIIQLVEESNIDKNGYQTMKIENNTGKGYYISNGTAVPITWKKNESNRKMRYYNQAGELLTINPGKTFISVFPDNKTDDITFE